MLGINQVHYVIQPKPTADGPAVVMYVDRNGRREQDFRPFPKSIQMLSPTGPAIESGVGLSIVGTYGPPAFHYEHWPHILRGLNTPDAFLFAVETLSKGTVEELATLFQTLMEDRAPATHFHYTQLVKDDKGQIGFLHLTYSGVKTTLHYEPIEEPALWSGGSACISRREIEAQLTTTYQKRLEVVERLFDPTQTTGFSINEL